MKFASLATAAYLLPAHAQLSAAPKRFRGLEAADLEIGADSSMSLSSISTKDESSFVIADSSSNGGNGGGSSNSSKNKSKSGKAGKASTQSLVAILGSAGGELTPSGTASVHYNPDGSFLMSLDAAGLVPGCEEGCLAAITSAKSCDGFGADYYDDSSMSNPWRVAYVTSDEGFSNSAWRINNGFNSQENEGHTLVLYDDNNDPIGCGVLGVASDHMILAANLGTYPGYNGDIDVTGGVVVSYHNDGTFKFEYHLSGLEANCVGCGIHIHAGTSCDTPEEVKGHGWNTEVVEDLWTAEGGATYESDGMSNAIGYFNLYNGYSFGKNLGHAVVVHGQDGTRLACGVLGNYVCASFPCDLSVCKEWPCDITF